MSGGRLIVGAMSGTSADGVDAAIIHVTGHGLAVSARLVRHQHFAYDAELRQAIFRIRETGTASLRELASITQQVSLASAAAVEAALSAAHLRPGDITAVAAHGQTLYHEPPCTMQCLDPALLAAETGCLVVSDFRRADCAAGGQGAPLVPFADYLLFRDLYKNRILLNIGGIANITWLPCACGPQHMIAYDTGPGNCISDYLMRSYDSAGCGYDAGGQIAGRGNVIFPLLQQVLADPYFVLPPPKSTDGPAMIEAFRSASAQIGRRYPFENLLKTACLLTATTIADAIRRFEPFPDELIVSGGGVRNDTLMALLRQPLGELPVRTTDELGIPADAREAMSFALLGAATLDGVPSNIPSATGARQAVVLGSITPRPAS